MKLAINALGKHFELEYFPANEAEGRHEQFSVRNVDTNEFIITETDLSPILHSCGERIELYGRYCGQLHELLHKQVQLSDACYHGMIARNVQLAQEQMKKEVESSQLLVNVYLRWRRDPIGIDWICRN